jgi:hypothetical protein
VKVQEKNITKTKRIISESSRKNITKTKTKRIISERNHHPGMCFVLSEIFLLAEEKDYSRSLFPSAAAALPPPTAAAAVKKYNKNKNKTNN